MTAPSATELPTAQPNVPANSRHPGPRAVPSVSSVLILPPGPIVDRHRRPQERLQAARRPPAYPNQARIIAPVTPSHPSAVLTPSTCMNRWIRVKEQMEIQASTPTTTPTPKPGLGPGTYRVGTDIQPGIYAGKPGTGIRIVDLCYWERLRGLSGDLSDIIANNNTLSAVGQFYVEILPTDKYFKVDCDITPLNKWPSPETPLAKLEPGTYLVGRDIAPGTYRGEAGTGIFVACHWERLSGISGEFDDVIATDALTTDQYFVHVLDTDYALSTTCTLELVE